MSLRSFIGRPNRILYATDFSEHGMTAFGWAVGLAKAHDATLSVLHVVHTASNAALPMTLQEKIGDGLRSLETTVGSAGVVAETQWQSGKPWEVINSEASAHDLVVIGARGHAPFSHGPLGSTADRVIRSASVPVLTVHSESTAFETMPRKLIVPTDFSDLATSALHAAAAIFATGCDDPLQVTLLHAWRPLVEYAEIYAAVPPSSPYVGDEENAQHLLEQQCQRLRSEAIEVTPSIRQGHPATVIEEEAKSTGAKLIAMGTRGYSGLARLMLGSVTERVMHRVKCPMLTLGSTSDASE